MNVNKQLQQRSNSKCELCGSEEHLSEYQIPKIKVNSLEGILYACNICIDQMENSDRINPNHWRFLNETIWSEHNAVKIMSWRMLNRIRSEGWPQDLLDMMYLEDDILELAKAEGDDDQDDDKVVHRDVNGVILEAGDSVVLIKDLKVKGSSIIAKQGTAVRRISLDHSNAEYIEGKVDGQHIVIITKYVKKL